MISPKEGWAVTEKATVKVTEATEAYPSGQGPGLGFRLRTLPVLADSANHCGTGLYSRRQIPLIVWLGGLKVRLNQWVRTVVQFERAMFPLFWGINVQRPVNKG